MSGAADRAAQASYLGQAERLSKAYVSLSSRKPQDNDTVQISQEPRFDGERNGPLLNGIETSEGAVVTLNWPARGIYGLYRVVKIEGYIHALTRLVGEELEAALDLARQRRDTADR